MTNNPDWHNLYRDTWKGAITDEAFAHPAKFSRALIRHIYQHALENRWLKPGDTVIDPFGGVALGGLHAMHNGLHWLGCELEQKFVDLGNQNIAFWRDRFNWFPGSARLLQGDSRHLAAVLTQANASISSPPYADGCQHTDGNDPQPELVEGGTIMLPGLHGAVSSPPYADGRITENRQFKSAGQPDRPDARDINDAGYGHTPGQLGAMKGDGFEGAISSPPFGEAQTGGGIARDGYVNPELRPGTAEKPFDLVGERSYTPGTQGQTEGQLAGMDMTGFDGAVSSPPYEGSIINNKTHGIVDARRSKKNNDIQPTYYGDTNGNMGTETGPSFWLAARQIVEQLYTLLTPGAPAIWVVKDFVRNKQRVPFCDQWRQLCEAVGFETACQHRAWLVEEKGTQIDLLGNHHTKTIERKSFFRRLAEKKGSPRIDYEIVLCTRKPDNNK